MFLMRKCLAASLTTVCVISCGAPTSPSSSQAVQSFALPVLIFQGNSAPNYAGDWSGEYLLAECRASSTYSCKDAPMRRAVRLQISQSGSNLAGSMEFEGRTFTFQGVVTSDLGIAGGNGTNLAARLMPSGDAMTGFIVSDYYRSGDELYMSKRYNVLTPLRRQ